MRLVRAGLVAAICTVFAASFATAQNAPGGRKTQTILCPKTLNVAGVHSIFVRDGGVPLNGAAPGWNTIGMTLETYTPPNIRQGMMICHYKRDGQIDGFQVFQMVGHRRCVARADKRGFDCRI